MKKLSVVVCFYLALSSSTLAAVFFNNSSAWKYFVGTQEASTPREAWRAIAFNDSAWSTGNAPIGFGEAGLGTTVPTGTISVYHRKTFVVSNVSQVVRLDLTIRIDDGFVVWINGTEVGRYNVPAGELAWNALAPNAFEPDSRILQITNHAGYLVNGTNVIAIHAFNQAAGSSDIYMDASLIGLEPDPIPPTIANVAPSPGNVTVLNQISVLFSEPVNGVHAADLLINGQPASSVTGGSNAYTFSFVQPAFGPVQISWSAGHGIEDLGFPPNPFNATGPGATWQYNLVDNIAPTVVSLVPAAGFTVRSLTNIQVSFSEAVTGVDAADLLIKGAPAAGVTVSSPSSYTFNFPQPTTGAVQVAWSAGHGIRDVAAAPNNFAGGNWSYVLDPNAAEPDIIITEFMAGNTRTLADEDGDFPDWIEIYNTGTISVDLNGWSLTDDRNDLTKWTFPATNLPGGSFMIIFASEEDRRVPGRPLHTNFRLGAGGEYLALVKPDGTIASAYSPTYPPQVDDVSYGLPTVSAPTVILAPAAPANVYVPTNNNLGVDWTLPNFNDSAWLHGSNGVGFETAPAQPSLAGQFSTDIDGLMRTRSPSAFIRIPFVVNDPSAFDVITLRMKYDDGFVAYVNGAEVARRNVTVANSVSDFSDTQGSNNWFYGYYNKTTDGDATYQASDFTAFPRAAGAWGAANFWTGTMWDWFAGNPPWTEISATGGHPNGSNNGNQHWAIRRWVSEVAGNITVHFRLAKSNVGGGNGVTGRIFHNGVEQFTRTIAFNDGGTLTNDVSITGVMIGDTIDIALDATGTDGQATDGSDGSIYTAVIDLDTGSPFTWDAVAASSRADTQATAFEDIDISNVSSGIQPGTNWLAIHGLNFTAADGDFLIAAQIETRSTAVQLDQVRYFTAPTPGAGNGSGVQNLGPIISDPEHTPHVPKTNEDIIVTARVSPTFAPVAAVSLVYRIMFMATNTIPMLDDGLHGDGAPGDGVYGAIIPSALSTNGQMRRWYITARDTAGRPTRYPTFANPANSPEYLGTIVHAPQTNGLPILHLFIPDATLNSANNDSAGRYPVSLFYLDRFYDNCGINRHGQSSAGFPKKSYDIDFNPGENFTWREGEATVDDVNLLTTYPDKAHIRNIIGYYGTYVPADSPYHFVEHIRVHHNAAFYGDWHMVENGDANYLERLGLDPNGALYKMYNTFTDPATDVLISSAEAEKKTRKQEGNADLVALFNGLVTGTAAAKATYMWDNVNVPEVANTMAARIVTGDIDCCHKNYYFYRDSDGTGEWWVMPWDIDLSFGRNWASATTYWQDEMFPNNGLFVGNNNGFLQTVFNTTQSRQMYLRRLRTLLDEVLQPTNTPPDQLKYEKMIAEHAPKMIPDALLDFQKWGTWGSGSAGPIPTNHPQYFNVTQAITQLTNYLPQRRNALIHARTAGGSTEIPPSQPTNVIIRIGNIEFNPSNANQAEEYIQIVNTNNISVDISGWKLSGGANFTFRGGSVIVSNSIAYLSPNVKAFRQRATSPRGGQNLLVLGPYDGQLSARGETLMLTDTRGRLVASNTYVGAPSLPQQYLRITEIMYHPPVPPLGSPYVREDHEYLELKNIGPAGMNLAGVHFTNGIDYVFGNVTLNAGQTLILAKNPAAFTSRYPGVANVFGPYTGSLDNKGERIRLDDAVGEKILDFSYNNSWYPMTDGLGLSLVIVNENAPWFTWDEKASWRPSSVFSGSPGVTDPPALTFAPVLVNEVLSHTDFPAVDAIELWNPTPNPVDVGNWLITDDYDTPAKYRIPAPTVIPAGGYRVFTESDFNPTPGTFPSFSFGSGGEEAYLFSGDSSGNPNGYFHGFEFGAALTGVSFGRYTNGVSQGTNADIHIVAQSSNTLGFPNALPKVGPVVISEIMYHPPDLAGAVDNTIDEFIELQNITGNPVPLYDPAFPTNRWKLDDSVEFSFSTNDVIPPNGFLLVVSFNPGTDDAALARFRSIYNVPVGVGIVGPFSGKLDNNGFRTDGSGESVELYRPDTPETNGVPFVLVERIDYSDSAPWNPGADGLGPSLQRRVVSAYGNTPTNWNAGLASAGAAPISGSAPVILQQPQNVVTVEGRTTNLSVTVSGTAPITFQWRFRPNTNAPWVNVPGATSSSLVLADIELSQAGEYSVVVFNPIDVIYSASANVFIYPLPKFIAEPVDLRVNPGSNATLSATVAGTGNVRYQWRFAQAFGVTDPRAPETALQFMNIPNATNATYTIVSADLDTHHGFYSVVATDDIGSLSSSNAFVYVMLRPGFTVQPTPAAVVQGGTAVFTVNATGAPPLFYRWIRNGIGVLTSTVPILVLNDVQLGTPNPVPIRCAVTNLASGAGGVNSVTVQLLVQPDSDGDGIADAWETNYFGFSTNNAADGALDFDGDGADNREEFVAGTNPTNALSVLKLSLTTGNTMLEFEAQTNLTYSLQYRTNLVLGGWLSLSNVPGLINTVRTIRVTAPSAPPDWERYFRVATPAVP